MAYSWISKKANQRLYAFAGFNLLFALFNF